MKKMQEIFSMFLIETERKLLFPDFSSVSCFLLHVLSFKHMQNQIKGKAESLKSFSSFLWKKKIICLQ